jgi:predicted acylesterase/phospholipase RssA
MIMLFFAKNLKNKRIYNTITMAKKDTHRALVLQGGGSLGAYEAGVYRALYYWIKKDIQDDENVFDIVAGTSIGAINAALLVSYVITKKRNAEKNKPIGDSWKGSAEELEEFWKSRLASNVNLTKWWPFLWDDKSWNLWWDTLNNTNSFVATGEAARRYYSAKEFIINGAPNVFSRNPSPIIDSKFFDNFIVPNIWYQYDNSGLRRSMNEAIRFPIGTNYKTREPRLLAIAVDVEEGETVTFDSYVKDKITQTRKSEYGEFTPFPDNENGKYERIIKYDKGIMVEHILASASVPEHYDYTLVPKEYDYTKTEEEKLLELENYNPTNYSRFWDGGVLSNTPLRELITSHQDYWKSVENVKDSKIHIPDLEVYIIDVWPSVEDYPVPSDLDGIRDLKNDLTYQDKTPYDEKVANIVSDYYNLTDKLLKLAKDNNISQTKIDEILDNKGKSLHRNGKPREYRSLLEDRFDITRIIRVERSADINDIANKWCDFSLGTVSNLFNRGIQDALKTCAKGVMRSKDNQEDSKGIQDAISQLDLFISYAENQGTKDDLIQVAKSVKAILPTLWQEVNT